ncbi:MAG: HPF/RaiA family ribosome-associated protein [Holosporaceae bacterium]|nr:HPF/RaiA family ribosome-associated protein [Holosporaceae bacterium]
MNFSFSGRRMEIGEALTNRAKDSSAALAEKYGSEFLDVNVVMKKDGYLFCCDIAVKTNNGNSYYASYSASDPHACFDLTLEKIDQQMLRKKRAERKSIKGCRRLDINSFANSLSPDHGSAPLIIAEILDTLPLLSVRDAAKHLHDTSPVFVFENIATNTVNVVYSRQDGNIGWIDYKFK